jgi:hypothetical protein
MVVLVCLEILLTLTLDRCTVCVERTVGLEIVLDVPDGSPRGTLVMWNLVSIHMETAVLSVQDRCTVCAKRTKVIEIILDAPDGAPR